MQDKLTAPIEIGSAVQERDRLKSNACHATRVQTSRKSLRQLGQKAGQDHHNDSTVTVCNRTRIAFEPHGRNCHGRRRYDNVRCGKTRVINA